MSEIRLILASASPQRRVLLSQICPAFDVIVCPYPEPTPKSTTVDARHWAQALAYYKARSVADLHAGRWVLGADTVVACADRLLGKAVDEADAREMLELQARHVSEVITGVCLVRRHATGGLERIGDSVITRVWMRDDADLREAYLRSGDWRDKAGAYGIQSVGDRLIARLDGSFSNVVGLPLEWLGAQLRRIGVACESPENTAICAGFATGPGRDGS